jgi:branched-chain amino acid transport system permease protein
VLALAFAPFIFPGVKALSVAAKILVFVVLVASFDLLLGYTGIVSFAHTMFFGIGAYGIAISASRLGPNWGAVLVGWAHRWRSRWCSHSPSGCSRCGCARSSSR